jgi:hypothetical protein
VGVKICVGVGVCASLCGVQIGFPSWSGQVRIVNLGRSSRGVQVGVLWISWFPFYDGVSLPTTSR